MQAPTTHWLRWSIMLLGWLPFCSGCAAAGERTEKPRPNVMARTWGGKQYWADVELFHDWRIQRNSVTHHHRLLDGKNVRHTWGTLEECRQKLEEIKREQQLPPMQGEAVIVMHGLVRTRASMHKCAEFLEREGDYTVFDVGYPSTRADIGEHAACLASVIEHLDGIDTIYLVGHSLGNLVIRHYLADQTDAASGKTPDARIRRIVMLGPPNHGTPLAEPWAGNKLFDKLAGPAAEQIAQGPDALGDRLATPTCEFGIIAGGRRDEHGYNPLIPGDDDSVVPVESTRLDGATDFIVLPVLHIFLIEDQRVLDCTLRFLQHGYFVSEEERQPVKEKEEQSTEN